MSMVCSCGRCYCAQRGSNFGGHFIVGTKRSLRLDLNAMNDTVEGEWRAVGIGDAGGFAPMSIPMELIMTGTWGMTPSPTGSSSTRSSTRAGPPRRWSTPSTCAPADTGLDERMTVACRVGVVVVDEMPILQIDSEAVVDRAGR